MVIRPARPDDYAAYLRLFPELGVPDPVPSEQRFVEALVPQMRIACSDTGDVVGYVTWRPYGAIAHVIQIAVDGAVRGQRVGERMLDHVRGEARAAGCTRWYLNVKRDNTPALRLYDRVGFRYELESVAMSIAWARVPEVATDGALAEPTDDAAIAARFAIPVERLATFRGRGFRIVVVREDDIVAFAAFDPRFPGAATFSAARPELAAMRVHADPQYDYVRVTVEGDRALADAVLALGAHLTFEILRLGAPL
jgi:GNAT superfamily N-acetyltransferase